ncbi:MAG: hypothetical protein A6F71_10485 [Cycloclasticus sp. symbiont of Poecilosclerida sp. M]|nr:MAG: hypothetical protein A6F71_10485 [Cycloclasticus sp. symbiont of Poecilosclerida sp. M]
MTLRPSLTRPRPLIEAITTAAVQLVVGLFGPQDREEGVVRMEWLIDFVPSHFLYLPSDLFHFTGNACW